MTTKNDIFKSHLTEWLKAKGDRKKRGEMIEYISQTAKIHQKSVSRSFKRTQMNKQGGKGKRGPKVVYGKDVGAALYDIWKVANHPCGELLHPLIGEYVDNYKKLNKWMHSPSATNGLLLMSERTVKRRTESLREKYDISRGKSATKPSALKSIIPIFKGPWEGLYPGNGQLDTVAHCGSSLAGDFVYSVSFVDTPTYWGVRRAQWNKGQMATKNNLVIIKEKLPFKWLMAHPDSGGEFINWIAKDWCDKNGIHLTRSEPNKKNDNMYVEERNGHVIRRYLGYARLDVDCKIVDFLNEYYDILDKYLNHFQAVKRTVSKEKIGSKYKRVFEKTAKTPYQRVLENDNISPEIKEKIKKEHAELNPILLKEELDKLYKKIFNYQKNNNCRAKK